jgi:hypothetical protein
VLKEKSARRPSLIPPLLIALLASFLIGAFAWTGSASAQSLHSAGGGGNILTAGFAAVSQDSGAARGKHVFYRSSNGHLWMMSTTESGPVSSTVKWSAPTDLGGVQLSSAPAAVSRNTNRIDVFYVGPNGHLWTSWWDGSQSVWWSAPTDLGGVQLSSAPAAVSRNTNRIDVFYVGPNGHLWTSWWDGSQSIWWSAPTDLGGAQPSSAPATTHWFSREVYYRGPDGNLWDNGSELQINSQPGIPIASTPAATYYTWSVPPGYVGGGNGVDVYYGDANGHLWIVQIINTQGTIGWGYPVDLGKVDFT